jgi:hypothetical protein
MISSDDKANPIAPRNRRPQEESQVTIYHRITSSILAATAAGALALGAAGPASAMPYDFNANGSYGAAGPVAAGQPSISGSSSTGEQGAPPILPAPNRAQNETIQRAQQQQARRLAYTLPNSATYSNAGMNAYPSRFAAVSVTAPTSGFDWGDAGIGAAGGLVLSLLGIGGVMAVSQRHTRRSAALTS